MNKQFTKVDGHEKATFPRWVSVVAHEEPNSVSGIVEALIHFTLWIVVLVLEIMFFVKCKHAAFLFN